MEQRKKEQDVLVVKDEQTGEIGVVAGLKRDGTPNMRAAKPEHEREFLRFVMATCWTTSSPTSSGNAKTPSGSRFTV